ncbi:transposable element Tcb2 transposase [Trichonephila clavipes]|nr:transposable element Tcb2 transposase [Trichonephila clavipes]
MQLPEFERGKIITLMEAGWSARRVARQLGRSDLTVRRCWNQWTEDTSFTRWSGSGRPRQTSRREDRHIRHLFEGSSIEASITCAANEATNAFVWSGVTHDGIGLQQNGTRSSSAMNLESI